MSVHLPSESLSSFLRIGRPASPEYADVRPSPFGSLDLIPFEPNGDGGAVLLKIPGLSLKRPAVLRRGAAVAVPLLRLPWYSLRSYPFPFFFFQEEKRRRRAALELPRHTFRPGNLPADQEIMLTTEVSV